MSFDPFGDFATAGYLRNLQGLKDAGKVKRLEYLDRYLKPFLVAVTNRDQWPEVIGGIRGLDGLDKEDISYENLENPEVQQLYSTYRAQRYDQT